VGWYENNNRADNNRGQTTVFYDGKFKRIFSVSIVVSPLLPLRLTMNDPVVPIEICTKCGGRLVRTAKRNYSLLDLFGVAVVGSFVLGFLALFISLSHVGRAFIFLVWVGGLVAFGLYHMIGFKQTPLTKCNKCGEVFENHKYL